MTEQIRARAKLPLWRLVTGLAIFGLLIAVLLELGPVYVDNYQLSRYLRSLRSASTAVATPDETLRNEVLERAHQLDLPVQPGDIHISHPNGKLQLETKYHVMMNLSLYAVDLHMSAP